MYWQLREDFRLGVIDVPEDDALWRELTLMTYKVRGGKTIVESKDELKKRLGRSPDAADAVVYGNWVRPRASAVVALPPTIEPDRDPVCQIDGFGLAGDDGDDGYAHDAPIGGLSYGF